LWFGCDYLLTTSFDHAYHPWCIGKYTQLCPIVLFPFVTPYLIQIGVTWGLKLDSKDVQGKVGMKVKANMVQSLPTYTPNISFSNV